MTILTAIRTDAEDWTVLGFVGFGLAPSTVDICQIRGGVDVLEMLAEVGVGYEG